MIIIHGGSRGACRPPRACSWEVAGASCVLQGPPARCPARSHAAVRQPRLPGRNDAVGAGGACRPRRRSSRRRWPVRAAERGGQRLRLRRWGAAALRQRASHASDLHGHEPGCALGGRARLSWHTGSATCQPCRQLELLARPSAWASPAGSSMAQHAAQHCKFVLVPLRDRPHQPGPREAATPTHAQALPRPAVQAPCWAWEAGPACRRPRAELRPWASCRWGATEPPSCLPCERPGCHCTACRPGRCGWPCAGRQPAAAQAAATYRPAVAARCLWERR